MILNIFYYGLEKKALFNKLIKHLINNRIKNNLLLIQNGVYFGLYLLKKKLPKDIKIYMLELDLSARGLLEKFIPEDNVKIINYKEFVDLILEHDKNITW